MKTTLSYLALIAMSCACSSTKHVSTSVESHQIDSVVYSVTEVFDTVKVEEESVSLIAPILELKEPVTKINGRASLMLEIKNDTLYAEARCDSLEVLVSSYREQIFKYQKQLMLSSTASESKTVIDWSWRIVLITVIIIEIILFLIRWKTRR